MARRLTNIGTQVEYVPDENKKRATNVGVQFEYLTNPTHIRRLTTLGVMVEYVPVSPAGRSQVIIIG